MFRLMVAIFFVLGSHSTCHSKDAAYAVGMGLSTCGEFAQNYRRDSKLTELVYVQWAAGFLSGMNMQLAALNKPGRNIDYNGLPARLREGCDRRPLAAVIDVLLDYFNPLSEAR